MTATTTVRSLTAINIKALAELGVADKLGATYAVLPGTPAEALAAVEAANAGQNRRSIAAVCRKLADGADHKHVAVNIEAAVATEAAEDDAVVDAAEAAAAVEQDGAPHRHEPSYRFAMVTGTSDAHGGLMRTRGTCACGVELMGFVHGQGRRTVFFPAALVPDLAAEPLGPVAADEQDDAPACDMADGCDAAAGEPCEAGCPSLADDAADDEETEEEPEQADAKRAVRTAG